MKIEIIDLVIFGNFVIIGLIVASIFTDISNKRKMVVEGHADRLDRIEVMAADIDLKMGLILDKVKKMGDHE